MREVELLRVQVEMLSHCGLHLVLHRAIRLKVLLSEHVWVALVEVDEVVSVREGATVQI